MYLLSSTLTEHQPDTYEYQDVGRVPHLLVEDDDDDDEEVADEADDADDREDEGNEPRDDALEEDLRAGVSVTGAKIC